jgi:hypothetical protein
MSEDIDQASAWEASKKLRQNLCVRSQIAVAIFVLIAIWQLRHTIGRFSVR